MNSHKKYTQTLVHLCPHDPICIYIFTNTQRPLKLLFSGMRMTESRPHQSQHWPLFPQSSPGSPASPTFICWVLGPWHRHCSKNSLAVLLPGLRKPKHRAASMAASFDDFISICSTGTNCPSSPTRLLCEGGRR